MIQLPKFDFSQVKFLSPETIEFHYGKHHKAYIDKYNQLIGEDKAKDFMTVMAQSEGPLFNNAAQSWNHTFYWMGLLKGAQPLNSNSKLSAAITASFGSEEKLKEQFVASAIAVFGSGWTWLVENLDSSKLEIVNTGNAALPDLKKYFPVMVCDVWEHAYYIDFRNSRPNYLNQFWSSLSWGEIEGFYQSRQISKVSDAMKVN